MTSYKFDEDINHIKLIQFSVFSNDIITDYSSVNKDANGINLQSGHMKILNQKEEV